MRKLRKLEWRGFLIKLSEKFQGDGEKRLADLEQEVTEQTAIGLGARSLHFGGTRKEPRI